METLPIELYREIVRCVFENDNFQWRDFINLALSNKSFGHFIMDLVSNEKIGNKEDSLGFNARGVFVPLHSVSKRYSYHAIRYIEAKFRNLIKFYLRTGKYEPIISAFLQYQQSNYQINVKPTEDGIDILSEQHHLHIISLLVKMMNMNTINKIMRLVLYLIHNGIDSDFLISSLINQLIEMKHMDLNIRVIKKLLLLHKIDVDALLNFILDEDLNESYSYDIMPQYYITQKQRIALIDTLLNYGETKMPDEKMVLNIFINHNYEMIEYILNYVTDYGDHPEYLIDNYFGSDINKYLRFVWTKMSTKPYDNGIKSILKWNIYHNVMDKKVREMFIDLVNKSNSRYVIANKDDYIDILKNSPTIENNE